jgi:hypothetical protein
MPAAAYNGNGDCGCGESWGHKFRGRFGHHGCGCEEKKTCCGGGLLDKWKHHGDCGCDTGCGTAHRHHHNECDSGCGHKNECDSGCGHRSWGGHFKGMFHHGCNDCGGGCDNGCGNGAVGAPAHAEPIPAPKPGAPKKMPDAPPKSASTLIIEQ